MKTNSNFDGQKHCSCKKSKCLKLYCDCFAAGLYCDDACSCQQCFNLLDYEDTVDETRQQIELRNPFAFSTKIHNVEDGNLPTTIAGKHKRGCTCKKSMCIKRYCECYQANVGCSDECRCEGCKNVFGKKGEYNVHNKSTPWTPSQHSGHIEDASPTDLFAGCYTPSPGSTNCDTILGTDNWNFDDDHLDQQFTLPHTSNINARYLTSDMELLSKMDWQSGSRASDNDSSVIRVPGSLITPAVSLFGGSKVDDSHEKPVNNVCDKTTNAARNSYIDPNTSTTTSSSDK